MEFFAQSACELDINFTSAGIDLNSGRPGAGVINTPSFLLLLVLNRDEMYAYVLGVRGGYTSKFKRCNGLVGTSALVKVRVRSNVGT